MSLLKHKGKKQPEAGFCLLTANMGDVCSESGAIKVKKNGQLRVEIEERCRNQTALFVYYKASL